jgi:ADP-L-glycero-D-manno-heptose 6-epimerase
MKAMVTGASGLIGFNLLKELLDKGHEVIAVCRNKEYILERLPIKIINSPFYKLDWNTIEDIDILFHQAAITDTTATDEKKINFVNTTAPIKLFKEAIAHGCKKIIYASSTAVYGNSSTPFVEGLGEEPLNVYGKSKLALDKEAMNLAKEHPKVRIVGLRYCNVFGPGENFKGKNATMVYQFAQQMLKENPKIYKDGKQKRDYLYVKDVAFANLCALTAKESCVVNLGTGSPVSFNELIKILNETLGTSRSPEYMGPLPSSFQKNIKCDIKKAKEKIGFTPKYTFKEGVEDYYKSGSLVCL